MTEPHPDYATLKPQWEFLAPAQQSGELGRLAQYRVLKELGKGGMGVVFQAEDTQLRRPVALKVMRPDCAGEEARARFVREARAAAALKHDHIVTIYQVGEDRGVPFLAMEFLVGKSLEEWLRPDRRASIPEAITIAKQIARGLAAAHEAGLIHRDIKPANLWLEAPRGRLKILDFGLARLTAGEFTALTQNGAVLGTPAFMAPEQARGEVVDHRCDLFSFGCVFYRMVTGRLPFQGNTLFAVLAAVASQAPPAIRELNPEVPPGLADLIIRLLAKKPGERPASAKAVLDELLAIEKELKRADAPATLTVPPRPPEPTTVTLPKTARPWRFVASGLAVATALALIAVLAWPLEKKAVAPPDSSGVSGSGTSALVNSVDLMALIDVSRDRLRGKWTLQGRRLYGQPPGNDEVKVFTLALPWEPPAEYRVKLTVTRQGNDKGWFGVGLTSGSGRFSVMFDAPQPDGRSFTGIGMVNQQKLAERPDAHVGPVLATGLPIQLACVVRTGSVAVEANGHQIYQWVGDVSRLQPRGPRQPASPLYLWGNNNDGFTIEDLTLEPFGSDAGKAVEKGAPAKKPAATPSPSSPGEAVDLLALVDVSRDRRRGFWAMTRKDRLEGHALAKDKVKTFSLVLPWDPPPEYRLKVTASRVTKGDGHLALELASGSARFAVVIDAPRDRKLVTGLSMVDGQKKTLIQATPHLGQVLPVGVPVALVCTVRERSIVVEADGREIYQWEGDLHRLSRAGANPSPFPLGLHGAQQGVFAFEQIVLEPLGPDAGKPLTTAQ